MLMYLRLFKRSIKWLGAIVVVLLVLVSISIVTEHYLFPKLGHTSFFSKYSIFQRASENVTIINNTQEVKLYEDDVLQQLARDNRNSLVTIISTNIKEESVVGSGAFVTVDGVVVTYVDAVLTNKLQKVSYTIFESNGTEHEATLLGIDTFTNLAFLKVEGTNYSTLRFANSDDIGPGRKIAYVGISPSSGEERIASGIISEKAYDFNIASQSTASTEKLEGVMLAQINTSYDLVGLPVMNMQGEVVGIHGKKQYDNLEILFVIPSNRIERSLAHLRKGSSFERPQIGASYISLNKVAAIQYGVARDEGALIYTPSGRQSLAVLSGSPAALAGLRIGDIVLSVDEQQVNLKNPLANVLQDHMVDEVTLKVLRAEKEIDIVVQL